MDKGEKLILCSLLLFLVGLVVLLGTGYEGLLRVNQDEGEPFIKDRVATIRIVMAKNDWKWIMSNPMAERYVRADFWFDGKRYPNVAVRPKGMSSLMSVARSRSERLSLKIDFNFFNSAQTFRGLKKLCLNNGFSDPTLIREVLGYEIFEQMNIPTPRAAFVDLYVNDVHLGLYTEVEAIDKTFLARHFVNPNGNLYKPEFRAASLNWTKEDVEEQKHARGNRQQQSSKDMLTLNIGGSRLGDLLRLLERESTGKSNSNVSAKEPDGFGPPGEFGPPGGLGPPDGFGPPGRFAFDPDPIPSGMPRGLPGGRGVNDPCSFLFEGHAPTYTNDNSANGAKRIDRPMAFGPRGFRRRRGRPDRPMNRFGMSNLLETMGLKTNENYQDHSALFRLLDVLNNCPDESFPEAIEKVLDVDQVLRFLAVSVMIVHLDNYIGTGHNYYLYEQGGCFTILPWDLNMAFGTFRMGVQGDIAKFYIDEPVTGSLKERPLVGRLLKYKPYLDKYHGYLEQLLSNGFSEGVIESRIDSLVAMIRPYVEKDETKFFNMEEFEKGLNEGSSGGGWMRRPNMNRIANKSDSHKKVVPGDIPEDLKFPFRQGRARNGHGGFGNRPGRRGPGGPGMNAPGLKSFIRKRRLSVKAQLDGSEPSKRTTEERERMKQRGFGFMRPPGGIR